MCIYSERGVHPPPRSSNGACQAARRAAVRGTTPQRNTHKDEGHNTNATELVHNEKEKRAKNLNL